MSRRLVLTLVLLASGLAGVVAWRASASADGSSRAALYSLGATGRRVELRSADGASSPATALLLATRGGRGFYELTTAGGRCYATGPGNRTGVVGGEACPRPGAFPSPAQPLLDLTVYEASPSTRAVHAVRIEGLAADGVAAVGVLGSDGAITLRVPVIENVYAASRAPAAAVAGLVALDAQGDRMATIQR